MTKNLFLTSIIINYRFNIFQVLTVIFIQIIYFCSLLDNFNISMLSL
nr:hypothetical protein CJLB15_00101 [Campylobacter phage CJLB-15]